MRIFWRYGDDHRHPPEQLARAIDHLGFTGYLLAIGAGSLDQWTMAASLARETSRTKFLIAVYPGMTSPLLLASQTATLDRITNGRIALNVINGETRSSVANGLFLEHDERYEMAEEYWDAWRRIMTGERVDYDGKHVRFKGAQLQVEGVQQPHPELFFGGSSPAGLAMAARQVQTYLTWGEPPALAGEKIAQVRALATAQGRTLRYGIRLHLIMRDTREEAWAATQRIYDGFDREQIALSLKVRATSDSVGVQRMTSLVDGKIGSDARDLEVSPDLWAGYTLTGKGPGTALVGDPETIAQRLLEYRAAGFDTFILSGSPLLEEAYRVADRRFPLLPFDSGRIVERPNANRTLRNLAVSAG